MKEIDIIHFFSIQKNNDIFLISNPLKDLTDRFHCELEMYNGGYNIKLGPLSL